MCVSVCVVSRCGALSNVHRDTTLCEVNVAIRCSESGLGTRCGLKDKGRWGEGGGGGNKPSNTLSHTHEPTGSVWTPGLRCDRRLWQTSPTGTRRELLA